MKKTITLLLISILTCLTFTGCIKANEQPALPENGSNNSTEILPELPTENEQPEKREFTEMYLTINGSKLKVDLAENSSVDALVEILKQGDIIYTADDYGGFEKVGSLGHTLPVNNTLITAQAGDVILYSGNQIVLFYGSNSWSYTRLGKINGYSADELRSLSGAGNGSVQITLSIK